MDVRVDSAVFLRAVMDTIVPGDEFAAASETAVPGFLDALVSEEKPELRASLDSALTKISTAAGGEDVFVRLPQADREMILDGLGDDPDYRWLARTIAVGYYGASNHERDPDAWRMIGWSATPAAGWPSELPDLPSQAGMITIAEVADHYDAIVIGTGAGGGVAAAALAESGRTVLIIEAGGAPRTAELASDHLRNPRVNFGLDPITGPPAAGHPRTILINNHSQLLEPTDPRWSNNAMTLGGGTRVYGAQAWRFAPTDFAMASHYGVPEGSALADWPFDYAAIEPYYSRAEWELGVSGSAAGDTSAGPRSRDYPMAPLPPTLAAEVLGRGATALGLTTLPPPLLINSEPYAGRAGCARCPLCVGFSCPVEAKSGAHNTTLPRAVATGRCSILINTTVERILTTPSGRVRGVAIATVLDQDYRGDTIERREIAAGEVVVSAGAVESARLLLNSAHDHEPAGIGNNHDQVGRHLQGHVYAGALGIFDDVVVDRVGPGPSIATCDFRHGNAGYIGGGMLANEFVPTPASSYSYLVDAGLIPMHGRAAKQGMAELARRMQRVVGPIQEVTTPDARVRVDSQVRDLFGNPVAALSGGLHPEDLRNQSFLSDRATEWLTASGARRVVRAPSASLRSGPSGGQHQAGTCRMGTDPESSVTDQWGRVWGHDNLRVVDGSLHVTNGGVNPVLTILANALRIMDQMTEQPHP